MSSVRRRADQRFGLYLLSPSLLFICTLVLIPLALLVLISMKALKLGTIAQFFNAAFTVANYQRVLNDPMTWHSPRTSSLFISILPTDEGGGVASVEVRAGDAVTTARRHISSRSSGVI